VNHRLTVAMERPLDVLASAGVLYSMALAIWPPPGFWWASIAWGAAAGWIICAASFAICGHPQALRWAAVCGLLAGSFTWMPILEPPTMAPVFRVFLPLALRLALRLPCGAFWAVATLAGGAAVAPAGWWADLLISAALLWSVAEFLAGFGRARWARGFGFAAVVPTGFAAGGSFGFDPFVSGAVVFTVALFALIIYASLASAKLALPKESP
jgi:hypothetical protein